MMFRTLVNIAYHILPKRIFNKIRRKYALCNYGFHSALKVWRKPGRVKRLPYSENCKHCGKMVYRDRYGQWREHLILSMELYDHDENGAEQDFEEANAA